MTPAERKDIKALTHDLTKLQKYSQKLAEAADNLKKNPHSEKALNEFTKDAAAMQKWITKEANDLAQARNDMATSDPQTWSKVLAATAPMQQVINAFTGGGGSGPGTKS